MGLGQREHNYSRRVGSRIQEARRKQILCSEALEGKKVVRKKDEFSVLS